MMSQMHQTEQDYKKIVESKLALASRNSAEIESITSKYEQQVDYFKKKCFFSSPN
jgi:hypothetical protein